MSEMLKTFIEQRDRLLLEMDEGKIRRYYKALNVRLPVHPEAFWRAVHKARTGAATLPEDARRESAEWLKARGSTTFDDGKLS